MPKTVRSVRLGQVSLVRLGQVRLGQVRLGQVRLGQVRFGQVFSFSLQTIGQTFIFTFLFLPFLLQKNTHSCFVSFFPKREINSLKLLFFPNYKPWMYFFMMEKIIFFTFHLCKKLGWPKVGDTDLSPLNGCGFVSSRMQMTPTARS